MVGFSRRGRGAPACVADEEAGAEVGAGGGGVIVAFVQVKLLEELMPHSHAGLAIDIPCRGGEEEDREVEVGENVAGFGFEVGKVALVMLDCFGIWF